MFHFKKLPHSIVQMFNGLCLSQVKDQLTENLTYFNPNPPSFVCNGHLFAFTNNKSFLIDEHQPYGIMLKFKHSYN